MNGSMAEAQNGVVTLESVNESTMERFIDWTNYRSYTPAAVQQDPNVPLPPPGSTTVVKMMEPELRWPVDDPMRPPYRVDLNNHHRDDERSGDGVKTMREATVEYQIAQMDRLDPPPMMKKSNKKPKTKKDLKEFLSSYHCECLEDENVIPPLYTFPQTRRHQRAHEDYTELLLSHARLHVFADMYAIQSLKILTLENLRYTLVHFEMHPQRTGDMVALLQYVYANTLPEPIDTDFIRDPSREPIREKKCPNHLRTMLMVYVASEMSVLMRDEKFKELLVQDGGPLLADFLKMVAFRIH